MASTALFAEVYIIELIMGRFLVREISVIIHSRRNVREVDALKYEHIVPRKDPAIQLQAEDVDEPWGAVAAVKELDKLCGEIPLSIFDTNWKAILLFISWTLAFLLNDAVNSSGDPYEYVYWPLLAMITAPFVCVSAVNFLKNQKRKYGTEPGRDDGIELKDVFPDKASYGEMNNPIHT